MDGTYKWLKPLEVEEEDVVTVLIFLLLDEFLLVDEPRALVCVFLRCFFFIIGTGKGFLSSSSELVFDNIQLYSRWFGPLLPDDVLATASIASRGEPLPCSVPSPVLVGVRTTGPL